MKINPVLLLPLLIFAAVVSRGFPKQASDAPPGYLTRLTEPGGRKDDIQLASANPNEYAWRLFFYVNRQAGDKRGQADASQQTFRNYTNDGKHAVVWETWALANQNDDSEVFPCPPPPQLKDWNDLPPQTDKTSQVFSLNLTNILFDLSTIVPKTDSEQNKLNIPVPPSPDSQSLEVRINRSAYDTIEKHHLWSLQGVLNSATAASHANPQHGSFVSFHPEAKAIKARWVLLCGGDSTACPDMDRYHWRWVTAFGGAKRAWGLAALHIMTRDLDHWFWADFIHFDCLRTSTSPCNGGSIGPHNTPAESSPRPETVGTKWENYRLMGTETEFTTKGIAQRLADPMIEDNANSSCITCHAYAAATAKANTQDPLNPKLVKPDFRKLSVLGEPQDIFCGTESCKPGDRLQYFQSSFLWSIVNNAKDPTECVGH